MRKGKSIGKILGMALIFAMIWSMLGELPSIIDSRESNVNYALADTTDVIIDTEVGESRFIAYPDRGSSPTPYWVWVHDHDIFHTKAHNGNFWYTLCCEAGYCEPLYVGSWQVSLPESGEYEVFVWIPDPDPFQENWPPYRVYTPTQHALYQIYSKVGGVTLLLNQVSVDQSLRLGGWYSLGRYQLDTLAVIRLINETGEPYQSTMVAYDAVKFVRVDGTPPQNQRPIASILSLGGQPKTMHPNVQYTVAAAYHDPDGMEDLHYCYLRLNHPTKPLTLMWNQATDEYWAWAGEEGANYVTVTGYTVPMPDSGYDLNWQFTINDAWPEVEDAIDFGVYAVDDQGATSGWDYDDSNASFVVGAPDLPPDTEITSSPSGMIDYDDATFAWTGSDDVTPVSELVYSYCLEGYDTEWSDWTTDTSKQYSRLPNRSYTFKVKAKDLADNVDASPAERTFTIDVEWSFAIITDFHIGWCNTDYGTEGWDHDINGQDYWLTDRLNGIVEWINENEQKYNIDFVVVLGDIADSAEYSEFPKAREALNNLNIPYIPVIGNHDIWPYTQQEETCECPVTHMQFHCERLWRDLRVPKTWAPSAMGYEFFEEIFWQQNNQNVERIETLFGTSWSRQLEELGIPLENYAFTHNGVKFIALDFVDRLDDDPEERPESSGAKLHSDTLIWLTAKMKKDEPTILLSHHPIWSPAYFPIVDATTIRTAISNSGADVLANFGGHIHDQDEITSSANLAGIDSILTEAVCRESIIWPLAQKGDNIRIVKIGKDEKIKGYEFGNINDEDWDYPGGEFWAWSPVDLMITDPDEFTISKETGPVAGMVYLEMDVNHDDDPEDLVILDELKIGDYEMAVIPEPGASPTETYSLEVSARGVTIVLADDVQIGDIPSQGYIIRSTESEIIQVIPLALQIFAFGDASVNGQPDPGEEGLGGWYFEVTGPGGYRWKGSTSPTGSISLEDLAEGVYTVKETLKEGWYNTTPLVRTTTVDPDTSMRLNFGNREELKDIPPMVPAVNHLGIIIMIALFAGLLVWTIWRRRLVS